VQEAPIHFECKLERVLELGPKRQALLIGEVSISMSIRR
jgi:flavin reductase (DIM6/NTAB) family NADH-FMN oxidoreductase RutF